VADHYHSASGLTLTASRADLFKTLAQSQPRSYGASDTFLTSHIAQFCRDWAAMLGYRSADQNGGSARGYLANSSNCQRSGHHGHLRHDSDRARIFMQTVVYPVNVRNCRAWHVHGASWLPESGRSV
jgi:hypothetical protein